jgi:dipeptidyl aminopeptidase/acylaminoacyl peptidase
MACRPIVGLTLLILLLFGSAAAQERGFQPEDYYRIVTVSEAVVSPPGTFVAFTVTTVVEEANTRHRAVWLQPLRNGRPDGEPFRVTDPTEESSSPTWSPDGTLLSFSSRRGEDPNTVWFLRVEGPGGRVSISKAWTGLRSGRRTETGSPSHGPPAGTRKVKRPGRVG